MKPYARKASVCWLGTRQRGKGAVSTASDTLMMPLYAAGGDIKRRGTNPPELIAAAQAGSFSLSLANELGKAGYRPRQIDTTATVTMENMAAGWTMTQILLDVSAAVPLVAECDFVDAALRAKANCPISRALNANISMRATLSPRDAVARLLPQWSWGTPEPGAGRKKQSEAKGRR
ncbi:MAG TPA: OsmC family peroxiredoxin [Verrucomicrobiae bacterium]